MINITIIWWREKKNEKLDSKYIVTFVLRLIEFEKLDDNTTLYTSIQLFDNGWTNPSTSKSFIHKRGEKLKKDYMEQIENKIKKDGDYNLKSEYDKLDEEFVHPLISNICVEVNNVVFSSSFSNSTNLKLKAIINFESNIKFLSPLIKWL